MGRISDKNKSATTIVVGLDLGTHGTKILVRQRGDQRAFCFGPRRSTSGYARFVFPTLIGLSSDRIYFGSRARSCETVYRSIKVRLLGVEAEKVLPDYPPGPEPDLLVTAYLAWILRKLAEELKRRIRNPSLILNVGAPMDRNGNQSLEERYLHIIHAAWTLAVEQEQIAVSQGITLGEAAQTLEPLLSQNYLARATRRYNVLPETIAPLVSLSRDPRVATGRYMVIDMGAGTTEASVSNFSAPDGNQVVTCYSDQTEVFGGDDFERANNGVLSSPTKQELLERLVKLMRRVWANGYQRDCANHTARESWKKLNVLLTGGGTLRPEVTQLVEEAYLLYPWPKNAHDVDYRVDRHRPVDLVSMREVRDDYGMLAVANGLTVEQPQWPDYFSPAEVESLAPPDPTSSVDSFAYLNT